MTSDDDSGALTPIEIGVTADEATQQAVALPLPDTGAPDEYSAYLNEKGNDPKDNGPDPDPLDDEYAF